MVLVFRCLVIFTALVFSGLLKAAPITVQDFLGRTVTLEQPAQRIVALAPHIVENVFSAGAGDKLVGVVAYSNYPEAAKSITHVGNFKSYSLEAIFALKPDLILTWSSGNGSGLLSHMEALNIPVYVDELATLEDIPSAILDIAKMAGTTRKGSLEVSKYLRKLRALRTRYSELKTVPVLYQIWNEPLQTMNGEHIISDVIRMCSGSNIFADSISIAPKISLEAVFDRDPEAIVASGMGEARPEWLDEWLQWPKLTAVANGNLYFVPPDIILRHTTRILDGAEILCDSLQQAREKMHD